MGLNVKFSRTFSIIILTIAVGVFLVPSLISMVQFKHYEAQEDRMHEKYQKELDDRIAGVSLSIANLGLRDARLTACVEENAMEYARVHPMNSGGIDSVLELETLRCSSRQIEDIS